MEEIERLAEEFLARVPTYVWDGATLPVPIEEIADTHVGLLVRDVDDLGQAPGAPQLGEGQSLSGLLLPALGEIWVNASEAREWPPRRRFTIAHELGHWALHRNNDRSVFCRPLA
jgi:IrrE N-terminal-like domain